MLRRSLPEAALVRSEPNDMEAAATLLQEIGCNPTPSERDERLVRCRSSSSGSAKPHSHVREAASFLSPPVSGEWTKRPRSLRGGGGRHETCHVQTQTLWQLPPPGLLAATEGPPSGEWMRPGEGDRARSVHYQFEARAWGNLQQPRTNTSTECQPP